METFKRRTYALDSVEVVKVIKVKYCAGKGTDEDLARIVTEYWSIPDPNAPFDGHPDSRSRLIYRDDPCAQEKSE